MRTLIKIIAIIIIIILIASSVYVGINLDDNGDDNGDTEAPTIDDITRDTTGTTGKITSISVIFSDNIEVTEATIYFKSMNAADWTIASILTGEYDISIPSESITLIPLNSGGLWLPVTIIPPFLSRWKREK